MDRRRAILLLSATCTSLLAKPIEAFASAMPFSWYQAQCLLAGTVVRCDLYRAQSSPHSNTTTAQASVSK